MTEKKEYKSEIERLGKELAALQRELKERGIPVVIVLDGLSAAGKATLISEIVYPLDPRNFKIYTKGKISEDEVRRPFLWGYWIKLPQNGDMVIFDKSWGRAAVNTKESEFELVCCDINAFERQLCDSGMLLIKLFLQIGREEQSCRLKELEKNPVTAWRVNHGDLEQNKHYDEHLRKFKTMLKSTDSENSRWHIIESDDRRFAAAKSFNIIIDVMRKALEREDSVETEPEKKIDIPIILSGVEQREVSDDIYQKKLKVYQKHMSELGYMMYSKRRAAVIVYEGWDAAGKGGNIKRLTQELDPRGYEVASIFAPTKDELAHHYQWRFYNRLPKDGHLAIFDRSWYGRVLVERIEGYATAAEWQRAYREINEMERHWANHGVVIFKFWLHIDKDEQLQRFEARQYNPEKIYKITDEDWRNREKWELYEAAANEMLMRTSTDYAPWDIVPANDKKYARIHVLERVVSGLEKIL